MTRSAANLLTFRADVDPVDPMKPRRTRRLTPGANKGGRPRKYPEGSRTEIKVHLSAELLAQLDAIAKDAGVTRSGLVEEMLRQSVRIELEGLVVISEATLRDEEERG